MRLMFWRRDRVSQRWLAEQRRSEIVQSASWEGPSWKWDEVTTYYGWHKKRKFWAHVSQARQRKTEAA